MRALTAVDRGLEHRSGQTINYKTGSIDCAHRKSSIDCLARNQDNVSSLSEATCLLADYYFSVSELAL